MEGGHLGEDVFVVGVLEQVDALGARREEGEVATLNRCLNGLQDEREARQQRQQHGREATRIYSLLLNPIHLIYTPIREVNSRIIRVSGELS